MQNPFLHKLQLLLCIGICSSLGSQEITVSTDEGEVFPIEFSEGSTLFDIVHAVERVRGAPLPHEAEVIVEMHLARQKKTGAKAPLPSYETKQHGQFLGKPRNYYAALTESEAKDIHFLVTFLATRSLMTIASHRSELESTGDRIDHVHPLKFLHAIFSNEELKVGMRNIRARGWIWGDFLSGLTGSLTTEASHDNMHESYIVDFAKELEIDVNHLLPAARAGDWDTFIEKLIIHVPRKGQHGRYDN